jgi:hypothetical protein
MYISLQLFRLAMFYMFLFERCLAYSVWIRPKNLEVSDDDIAKELK